MTTEGRWYRVIAIAVLVVLVMAYTINEDRVARHLTFQNTTSFNAETTRHVQNKTHNTKRPLIAKSTTSVSKCIPQLTKGRWVISDNTTASWRVPNAALLQCGLTSNMLAPLQSTPEVIQNSLENKWVVFTGDSSTRMLFDYLLGRLVGNWASWPSSQYNNHGPPHSKMAQGEKTCSYEFWYQGTRLTFVWTSVNVTQDTYDRFDEIKRRTIGSPDIIFAQHGYWDKLPPGSTSDVIYTASTFISYLDTWLQFEELSTVFPGAYMGPKTHKVWLSLFHHCDINTDGVLHAKQANWTILDRTVITEPFRNGTPAQAHPMNEILEIELELVLAAIAVV